MTMWSRLPLLSAFLVASSLAAPSAPQWRFDLKKTPSGIVALEAIVVSPSLVLMFDRTCLFMQADIQGLTAFIRCQ